MLHGILASKAYSLYCIRRGSDFDCLLTKGSKLPRQSNEKEHNKDTDSSHIQESAMDSIECTGT